MEFQSMALLYNKVLRDRQIPVNKSDMTWGWLFNTPCRSLKAILVLFEVEQLYAFVHLRHEQVLQPQGAKNLRHYRR